MNKKRIAVLIMSMLAIVSLAACGGHKKDSSKSKESKISSTSKEKSSKEKSSEGSSKDSSAEVSNVATESQNVSQVESDQAAESGQEGKASGGTESKATQNVTEAKSNEGMTEEKAETGAQNYATHMAGYSVAQYGQVVEGSTIDTNGYKSNLLAYGTPFPTGMWPEKAGPAYGLGGALGPKPDDISQEEYDRRLKEMDEKMRQALMDQMSSKGTPEYDQALLTNFSGQYPDNLYANAK
ncbi:hypothetical protein [Floricoccus penangensis]|uniref:hypothetical protein n=1 Tax=Floricoccus penangensis TaxID=1859475 RepID=UPI00203C2010|nr:hypothetical protein [Floricoccus penangensis]URZ87130.1 hypothetical protein KIW23_08590 [Floricoccus penangensis]